METAKKSRHLAVCLLWSSSPVLFLFFLFPSSLQLTNNNDLFWVQRASLLRDHVLCHCGRHAEILANGRVAKACEREERWEGVGEEEKGGERGHEGVSMHESKTNQRSKKMRDTDCTSTCHPSLSGTSITHSHFLRFSPLLLCLCLSFCLSLLSSLFGCCL